MNGVAACGAGLHEAPAFISADGHKRPSSGRPHRAPISRTSGGAYVATIDDHGRGNESMGLFDKLLRRRDSASPEPVEHAVIVNFRYSGTDLSPLFALEDRLERAILEAAVGEFDGNEVSVDGSEARLYMYGPDADALLAAIRPILRECAFMAEAEITLRYGPPEDGVREELIRLSS